MTPTIPTILGLLLQTTVLSVLAAAGLAAASPSVTITTAPAVETLVERQIAGTPSALTAYTYSYSDVPYQVNPYSYLRGPQSGYNICNSTTEGEDSQCQTAIINNASDFCLWGAPGNYPNETIGDIEAAVVAYCTRAGHGARVLPPGAITGVQFMKTSAYLQVVGLINQTALNLAEDDTGGELDPHGADELGNPLGGLVYTDAFSSDGSYTQVDNWNNFVGSDKFCFKICFNNVTSPDYCQNKYDLLGCSYNMPAAYEPDVYETCEGDLQEIVGTYTANGSTITWSQPETIGPNVTIPWTPVTPASSNCVTHASSDLFPFSDLGYLASSISASSVSASSASVAAASSASEAAASSASAAAASSSAAASSASAAGAIVSTSDSSSAAVASATGSESAAAASSSAASGANSLGVGSVLLAAAAGIAFFL